MVRYAEDLVILCKTKEQARRAIDVHKAVFGKLEVEMNREKSKLINLWDDKQGFDFLGMHQSDNTEEAEGKQNRLDPPQLPVPEGHEEHETEGEEGDRAKERQ